MYFAQKHNKIRLSRKKLSKQRRTRQQPTEHTTGLCQCTTVRHDYHQPQQTAGGAEHTGQGGVSSTACHGVAKTTALVANSPVNNVIDSGHYIQDQNYRHSCLPLSPDPGLPTRKDTTVC